MAVMETGSVCIKKAGREAGKKVLVLSIEKDFALIDGPHVKRRKCNVIHLFPLGEKRGISANASHEEVVKALQDMIA